MGGAQVVDYPLFLPCSHLGGCSYFMTASGVNVKIYSVATGQVVSTLSPPNTSKPVAKTGYENFDAIDYDATP